MLSCTIIRRSDVHRWPAVPAAANTMPRTARSRSADGATTVALLPPSSSRLWPNRAATRGPTAAAHPHRPGRTDQWHQRVVDERSADRRVTEDELAEPVRRARRQQQPGPAARCRPARVSGVSSDGFHTTVSPQTSATAVFHDHTATGKLNARDDAHDTERVPGLHQPVTRPLRGHRPPVELTRQADREVADVDHLLHLAARLGADLADLERHQVGEVVEVLGAAARRAA